MVCSGGDCGAESVSGGAGRAAAIVALSVGGGGGVTGYGLYATAAAVTTAGGKTNANMKAMGRNLAKIAAQKRG